MLLFLLTLIYGCDAVSLNKFIGTHQGNATTMNSMGFLQTIEADPKKFVSEAEQLDPAALANVIGLLEELLLSSQTREDHLVGELQDANDALDVANNHVLDAEDDLVAAQDRTTAAIAAVSSANQVLSDAQQEQTAAEAAQAAVEADLDAKRQVHTQKQTEQGNAQTAHDDEIASLNNEQQIIQEVIDMLKGLPDANVATWQLVAHSGSNTNVDAAFWNSVCGNFNDLTVSDTILVEMGQVKDYFHPTSSITMCQFLLTQQYTWSATEDGTYVAPNMYGGHYGGSQGNWPHSIDGRTYLSFWGGGGANGGCCHYTSTNYGGAADGAAWHREFTLSVKYA